MATKRIHWKESEHGAIDGFAGEIRLFVFSWRTSQAGSNWRMTTTLPGLTRQVWSHDDMDALKNKAEKVLAAWLNKVDPKEEK